MPGAVITPNQPTGAGAGSPGIARRDLWRGQQIQLVVGTGGNSRIEWALVDKPAGSSAFITNSDQVTATFTPDVRGTYRVQLVTNGGGPGNVQILVLRVRFTNTGTPDGRQYVLPALGEVDGESNYLLAPGVFNARAWSQVFEEIFADIEANLGSQTAGGDLSGTYPNPTVAKINGTTVPVTTISEVGKYLQCTAAGTAAWATVVQTLVGDSSGTIGANQVNGLTHVNSNLSFNQNVDALIDSLTNHKVALGGAATTSAVDLSRTGATTTVLGNFVVNGTSTVAGAKLGQLPLTIPYRFVAGFKSRGGLGSNAQDIVGYVRLDPSALAAGAGGVTRTITFQALLWATSGTTVQVQVFNLSDGEVVTGTTFTTTSTSPSPVVSASLTVGTSSGNVKTTAKTYALYINVVTPNPATGTDAVTVDDAYFAVTYS